MPCLVRKPNSPYWMVKFRDASGRVVMRSSKQRQHRDALKVALIWEDASRKARAGELTEAAATKVLRELMEQVGTGTLRSASIAETFDGYLDACMATGAAASTRTRYKPIFRRLIDHLGPVRARASISSLLVSELESWRNAQVTSGLSGRSVNMAVGVIRAALNAAKRRGEILHNPADAINDVPERSDERQPFSDEEITALLKKASPDWQGVILTAAWTGLRLADAARLSWGQVDLEAGALSVAVDKTDRVLEVPLANELKAFLNARERGVGKAPIFPSLHGRITGRNGGLSNEFARLMVEAKVVAPLGREKKGRGRQMRTKSFHSLRHAFVSRLANADVPADVRKALAGHNTDEAHARYVHLASSKQVEALGKLTALGGWR